MPGHEADEKQASFDNGGRSYGRTGSPHTIRIAPS